MHIDVRQSWNVHLNLQDNNIDKAIWRYLQWDAMFHATKLEANRLVTEANAKELWSPQEEWASLDELITVAPVNSHHKLQELPLADITQTEI